MAMAMVMPMVMPMAMMDGNGGDGDCVTVMVNTCILDYLPSFVLVAGLFSLIVMHMLFCFSCLRPGCLFLPSNVLLPKQQVQQCDDSDDGDGDGDGDSDGDGNGDGDDGERNDGDIGVTVMVIRLLHDGTGQCYVGSCFEVWQ